MNKHVNCHVCHIREAVFALQYIASDDPTFSTLGSHYRDFPVIAKVCDKCAESIRDGVIAILPA